jgi:NAD(P)-dependent dehydrogenase (short-subunit alcohol dehydrogenase family)
MAAMMVGKVALVTGGSSGIGRATALCFAREGAKVVVAARRSDEGEQTAHLIQESGGEAVFVKTDISRGAEVQAMVATCLATFGRLDYACNNAGIEGPNVPTIDCREEDWEAVIDINLKGTWLCLKYEIPPMITQGGGAIVNMASIGGLIGFPGLGPYVATKHGIIGLTKTVAMEHAQHHIRVNAVCPGLIDTPMADRFTGGPASDTEQFILSLKPMRRRGTPTEIAEAVVWLCSDAASFVTGHSMIVDGGFLTI